MSNDLPATSKNDLAMLAPESDGPVCVGYSGGLDSTVLLHRLATTPGYRRRGLRAVHVNHGLHADADTWDEHCRAVCATFDIALTVIGVQVARDGGDGPEAAARDARHAAFDGCCAPGEIVALAHHRDDQAETFLLRALRGSGVDGLAAMRPWRARGDGWLWRPLLAQPRATLLAYAQRHALRWVEDASNDDTDFDRNYLRHQVLPTLQRRWPHARASLARSATLAAQASALLGAGDTCALSAVRSDDPAVLDVTALAALHSYRRARVLRAWIACLGLPPLPAAGVAAIDADLLAARPDARAAFAWHGAVVRRWRGLLHAGRSLPIHLDGYRARWDGHAPLPLPTGDTLSLVPSTSPLRAVDAPTALADARPVPPRQTRDAESRPASIDDVHGFDAPVTACFRGGGERIVLPGRTHSHALKDVLLQSGVPPWRRERLPLLLDDTDELLAAGDAIVSARLSQWLRDRGLMLRLDVVGSL